MMRGESSEVGGITNEDAMLTSEIVLQFGSSMRMDGAEEEVGLGIGTIDTCKTGKSLTKTLGLLETGVERGDKGRIEA
jgi:hypothetical protein